MSAAHKIRIRVGSPECAAIEVDGRVLDNVVDVRVHQGVDGPAEVMLTMIGDVEIDGEALIKMGVV